MSSEICGDIVISLIIIYPMILCSDDGLLLLRIIGFLEEFITLVCCCSKISISKHGSGYDLVQIIEGS